MTDIKKPMKSDERSNVDAEKIRRESRQEGEREIRRDVSDEDVGQDRILRKGVGNFSDDENAQKRSAPPMREDFKNK